MDPLLWRITQCSVVTVGSWMVPEDNERILRRAIAMKKKQSLYINQFLVRLVEKEKAGIEPEIHEGQIGPAIQLEKS